MADDFYQLLNVKKTASDSELKSAYRKMAMKYHPDRNPGDEKAEQTFKKVNQAYETLKDSQKRAAYDQYGHESYTQNQQHGGGAGHGGFSGGGGFQDIFEDLFSDLMGGQRGRAQQQGADLRVNIIISLKEAFVGVHKDFHVMVASNCSACQGTGAKKGTSATTCSTCRGAGRVRVSQGFLHIEQTCPSCHGQGKKINSPCGGCAGSGRVKQNKKLSCDIPAGIEEGTKLRLTGQGDAGPRGAPAGDLYIFVSIKTHELFIRNGKDLYCQCYVPMTVAALGGIINVPTIDGKEVQLKIVEGSQPQKKIRIKQKGMTVLQSSHRGDLIIELNVEIPVKLNKEQKIILEQFAQCKNIHSQPNAKSFVDKARDFLNGILD